MNPYFNQLGRTVLERWQEQNFSLEVFPELAQIALDEAPPCDNVDIAEMIQEFLTNDEQPLQGHSGFGQPELIAFSNPRFYIQILFWMEGTTDIHQHGFSGAFHVMHGSSVHSEFDFTKKHNITPHIHTGDLSVKTIELLETGRTVPIASGKGCIHSLFHLDTPSVTVVVRTQHDPGSDPQFTYLPPHIAINPVHEDSLTMRRKQLIDVLENIDDQNYVAQVSEMIRTLDFERGFHTLHHAMNHLIGLGEWEAVLAIFQQKHGELATGVSDTLHETLRRETITQMRHYIDNPEHRFFLALLMNVQNRKDILSLVSTRYRDQPPAETILRWIQELIEPSDYGLTLLDVTFPETIDADIDTQFELLIDTLSKVLEESPTEQPEINKAFINSCLRPLFT